MNLGDFLGLLFIFFVFCYFLYLAVHNVLDLFYKLQNK
jgi:hypothetical protein